jgi:hypothetical protein
MHLFININIPEQNKEVEKGIYDTDPSEFGSILTLSFVKGELICVSPIVFYFSLDTANIFLCTSS